MAIWELKSIDLTSVHWSGSTHKGRVIVRAESEAEARQLASFEFAIARPARRGEDSPVPPWKLSELASCKPFCDAAFEEEGPSEVLLPLAADR